MKHKQIVADLLNSLLVCDTKEYDVIHEVFSDNTVAENLFGITVDKQRLIQDHLDWRRAFPEMKADNLIIHQDDTVVVNWQATGEHQGDFAGYEATGKRVMTSGILMVQFENDKITYYRSVLDVLDIYKQLGFDVPYSVLPSCQKQTQNNYNALLNKLQRFSGDNNSILTKREVEVLSFWVNGRTAKEIANVFGLSYRTVQAYIANLMDKLDCNSRQALYAIVHDSNVMHLFRSFYDLCLNSLNLLKQP